MLEHPHVMATRPTIGRDSIEIRSVYVIETDLALSRNDPSYDEDAFQDLLVAASGYLDANPRYDSLKIVPYRNR